MSTTSGWTAAAEEAAILGLRAQILGQYPTVFNMNVTDQARQPPCL